jgi:hypothetical protein
MRYDEIFHGVSLLICKVIWWNLNGLFLMGFNGISKGFLVILSEEFMVIRGHFTHTFRFCVLFS